MRIHVDMYDQVTIVANWEEARRLQRACKWAERHWMGEAKKDEGNTDGGINWSCVGAKLASDFNDMRIDIREALDSASIPNTEEPSIEEMESCSVVVLG